MPVLFRREHSASFQLLRICLHTAHVEYTRYQRKDIKPCYDIRESRYPMFLRRKNATGRSGVDRKAEMASIGKSRGSLIDPRTEQSQVAIEGAIIEGTQFDPHGGSILHDAA